MKTRKMIVLLLITFFVLLTAQEKFSRNKNGDVISERGGTLILKDNIITDSKVNEKVLDYFFNETGLTIPEFIKHKREYLDRVFKILKEKKLDINVVFSSISRWYDYRVNLDKLDELKEAGFDALPTDPKVKGIGGKFESTGVTAEAIVIGKVVEFKKTDIMQTGFHGIFKIKIDEVIKGSKNITIEKEIKCGLYFEQMSKKPPKIGEKRVFAVRKTVGKSMIAFCPILMIHAWKIENNIITGKPNGFDEDTIALDIFKKSVKKVIKINDAENFFKRSWKGE